MRLTALLATLTFLTLAFAGCSDGGDGDGTTSSSTTTSKASTASSSSTSSSSSASATGSSSSSSTSDAPTNSPPTGSVSASVNGTNATFTLTGSDPDGDTLVWELDFGDGQKEDGTTLPATVNHTYAAGNYTANFTITDGTEPVTYATELTIVSGGGAGTTGQSFTGEWTSPVTACGGPYDTWAFGTPAAGVVWAEVTVDPATIGLPYTAVFAPDQAAPVISFFSMDFYDSGDAVVAGGSFVFDPGREVAGTVPAGAVNIMFASCAAAPVTVTYTAG